MYSSAHVNTERPQRYLKQLAAHLGRHLEVETLDPEHIVIRLDDRTWAELAADPTGIQLGAHAGTSADLDRAQDVVGRHLIRFVGADDTLTWLQAV